MVHFYGKVVELRKFKWGGFALLETFKGDPSKVQCVMTTEQMDGLKVGSWASVDGESKLANIKDDSVSDLEVKVELMEVLSSPSVDPPISINEPDPTFTLDSAFTHRGLSLQTEKYRRIFAAQDIIENTFRNHFGRLSFKSIHTPKITSGGAEGGADTFSLDYFGRPAYLAQSPQLYKQICCAAFGKVFEIGPVFRAEKHNTSRHLNEYISLDVETVCDPKESAPIEHIMDIEQGFLRLLSQEFNHMSVNQRISMRVSEAKQLLGTSGDDLSSSEEVEISKWAKEEKGSDVIFLTHYHRDVRPFYTKLSDDGKHTESFDCIFMGVEITSGGQRENDHQNYLDAMQLKGMSTDGFEFYLENFKYGFPVHGGFAIGLERLTAKLCDLPNVKMASLFPRDSTRLTP